MASTYWINTGWATGGVLVDKNGIIVDGAPIFRKLFGQKLADVTVIKGAVAFLDTHPPQEENDGK